MMTMSPGLSVGTRISSTYWRKLSAIDGSVDQPRCGDPIVTQSGQEGHGSSSGRMALCLASVVHTAPTREAAPCWSWSRFRR